MHIKIMSREKIERLAKAPFGERVALLSISDYGDSGAELKNKPLHLCRLAFDDVDNDSVLDSVCEGAEEEQIRSAEERLHMISEDDARRIAEFYFSVRDKVDYFICQCEFGQSRSAAVAAAILEYGSRRGITIFASDSYYPSKVVFRRVLKALKEENNELL
jgi:hypothetical protein